MAAVNAAAGSRNGFLGAVQNALLTAVVALVLTVPTIGLKTDESGGTLIITRHFDTVAWIVAVVFLGRLAMNLFMARRAVIPSEQKKSGPSAMDRLAASVAQNQAKIGAVGFLVAVVLPFFTSNYLIDFGTNVLIYVMLGWGLNIVVGLAGLLDLGYVAFYAVGAYTVALLATNFGFGFWICLPLAGLFAACFGVALGFPVLRLRGDYLAIVTLGFGEIIRLILLNWQDVTGGPNGIGGIPRPTLFGLPFVPRSASGPTFSEFFGLEFSPTQRFIFLYFLILLLALVTNFFTVRMRKLPVGRAWEALREDEIACRAIGINATNIKLSAFAFGAMFAGFAGSFFATRLGFISPESFTFTESATILAIVVLGGMGSQLGVVLAAIVLVSLNEAGRWFSFLGDVALYRPLIYGGAMVLIMLVRPRGLLAHRQPSILLHGSGGPRASLVPNDAQAASTGELP
ncbi:branched-chain amino acid ABC transporter permease [Aliidongia dinghuensis]|uniref:Branched-chain amino acid ABC transporter permease n=1 Tax=Aliidongia dinghuensis TaxID=1867774 RepID=A0A8J2YWP1_9PROT|nr:high-affinity branched-chain amino acid ABC transporter permease LivM [Aliidongia dinghuensis]GGF28659.1 branched-chain amino acid ABC transporter permease [Aliidongia dinghuensis]